MEIKIDFPGGKRVDAHFGSFHIKTDQPSHAGGAGSSPTPFATFLASIGTCAGIFVLGFCDQRGIPTEGIELIQNVEKDRETGMVTRVALTILLPPNFPEKYKEAVVRAAEQCTVKKHFDHPPAIEVVSRLGPVSPSVSS